MFKRVQPSGTSVSVVLVHSLEMGMFGQNWVCVDTSIFLFVCSTHVLKHTGVKLVFYQFSVQCNVMGEKVLNK